MKAPSCTRSARRSTSRVTLLRGNGLQPQQLRALSERALHAAAAGHVRPVVGQWFALAHAAAAHAAIEARATIGKTLLVT